MKEMNVIDEIKKRLNIVDLANEFGLQPTKKDFIFSIYREEKNRSLKLYPETNSFYCFATGKGGDVINFFSDFKKLDNKESIMLLCKELGLDNGNAGLEATSFVSKDKKIERVVEQKRRTEIYQTFETYSNGVDERALQYLTGPKRGLTEDSIKKFRLFAIKDLNGTIDYLLNSYHLDELKASGLFNENGRFVFAKHRLIIPYLECDKIVYLRGRVMLEYDNNGIGKYIGLSGQTAKRLFNLNDLKNLDESAEVLLCEGEFDTMRTAQQGLKVVGVPGVNNFPNNGKELLEKFDIYICLDNDEPGKKGMQEITNIIGKDIKGVYLKDHKDLTEYFSSNLPTGQTGGNNDLLHNENVEVKTIKAEKKRKSKLKLITAREIQKLDIPEIHWVIKDVLPEGLVILAGAPKIGKSWMALGFALSVTGGNKALGYFDTSKSTVVYIALEDNLRRIKSRIGNILSIEPNYKAPDNLIYLEESCNFPKLNENGIEELQKLVDDNSDIKLIIIDTLGRAKADKKRKDNNIYQADYDLGSKLQEFTMRNRICVLVIHHTKKGSEENVFDEISGTTGLTGAMDSMMVLKKKNNGHKLYLTGRDVKEEEYSVVFDDKIFCWNVTERKSEITLTAEREEILELIKNYDRPMKLSEITELIGKEKSNVSKMLKKLVRDGLLISPKYGFYELVKDEEDKKLKMTKKGREDIFNSTQSGQSG